MKKSKKAHQLLKDYTSGKLTVTERAIVDQWLSRAKGSHSPWEELDTVSRKRWLAATFKDIEAVTKPKTKLRLWHMISAAAACLIAVFLLTNYLLGSGENDLAHLQAKKTSRQISLSDGSVVWLNQGASIRHKKNDFSINRTVYLEGEAYFDVKEDLLHPFIVNAGDLRTEVLGTAFNIYNPGGSNTIKVTVTRGKVKVSLADKTLGILLANQELIFNELDRNYLKHRVKSIESVKWIPEDLRFDELSFAQVAVLLEQRYAVSIHFANPELKYCRFSGTAAADQSIDQVLNVICKFNGATFTRKENTITIAGKGCRN